MLNKCTDKAWFVVELCESIKALKIEIANFELYSSVPHEFRVSLGNAFPIREKDWASFGTFRAEDERNVQTFSAVGDVFGKYVKVEILSHHGTEHYCPISHFKIFGISEIELIGSDDDDDKNDDDANDDLDNHAVDANADYAQLNNNNVLKFIQDKMGETLEKVVGVFKTKDQNLDVDMFQALNKTSLVGTTFAYDISCPGCTQERLSDVYFLLATNFGKMSKALSHTNIRTALAQTDICENYGIRIARDDINETTSRYFGQNLVNFYTTLFGTSRIVALCNVLAIEQGLGRMVGQRVDISQKSDEKKTEIREASIDLLKPREVEKSDFVIQSSSESIVSKPVISSSVEVPPKSVENTNLPSLKVDSEILSSKVEETLTQDSIKKQTIVTDSMPIVDKIVEPISPTPVTQTSNGVSPSEMPVKEPELKDPPEIVLVPPSDASHIQSDDDASNGNGNKPLLAGQAGRESVWQKLSNRIKVK